MTSSIPGYSSWGILKQIASDFETVSRTIYQQCGPIGQTRIRLGSFTIQQFVFTRSEELAGQILLTKSESFISPKILRKLTRFLGGEGLIVFEGRDHINVRQPMLAELSPKNARRHGGAIAHIVDSLTADWNLGQEKDLRALAHETTYAIITHMMVNNHGLDNSTIKEIADAFETIGKLMPAMLLLGPVFNFTPLQLRYNRATRRKNKALQKLKEAAQNRSGLIARYNHAAEEGHIPHSHIDPSVVPGVLAGFLTVAELLTFILGKLLTTPELMKKAIQEIDSLGGQPLQSLEQVPYLSMVFMEAARYFSPVRVAIREAANDVDVTNDGSTYTIPRGATVGVDIWGMNHDSNIYKDADQFLPERWEEKGLPYLVFGAGPHACPGAGFAPFEVVAILVRLLQNFQLKLVGKVPAQHCKQNLGEHVGALTAIIESVYRKQI